MAATKTRVYHCAICNRRLKADRCIYSSHTRNRYCWPGEGCEKRRSAKLRKKQAAGS